MSDAEQAGIDGLHAEIADLTAENAELRSKLAAAEERIERATEELEAGYRTEGLHSVRILVMSEAIEHALDALSEPANADRTARVNPGALQPERNG